MRQKLPTKVKYQKSNLSNIMLHQLWWKLHDALESNPKLWRTPASLKEFCKLLDTNQNYLSQTITQATGINIRTLIHCYRIEYFIKKIENGEVRIKTIEGLIWESGFQNRSSFYAAFRRIMGCTVTEMMIQMDKSKLPTCP